MLRHAQREFSSIIRGEVRLLWVGCKNLVEGTLMGRDLVIFWLMGEYHPNPLIKKNPLPLKFFKPIRMLDSFTKNFSRMVLSFESVFCLEVQDYDWNLQNEFWLLMTSVVLYKCVSLKIKLMLLHIFKYVSASFLYQFTLYIIY